MDRGYDGRKDPGARGWKYRVKLRARYPILIVTLVALVAVSLNVLGGGHIPVFLAFESLCGQYHERTGRWPTNAGQALREGNGDEAKIVRVAQEKERMKIEVWASAGGLRIRYRGRLTIGSYDVERQLIKVNEHYGARPVSRDQASAEQ